MTTAPTGPRDRPRGRTRRAILTGAPAAVGRIVTRGRRRWPWFDHLARAASRYQRRQGEIMAAGVTYYAFLALFPVLLLVASVIGLVLSGDAVLQEQLFNGIRKAVPGPTGQWLVDEVTDAISAAGVVGAIGLIGFLYAGLRTMDKLRIGMENIWKGSVDKPEFLRDNLQDLLALLGLGAAGALSLGLTGGVTQATGRVLEFLGLDDAPGYGVLTWLLGIALAIAGDTVVFLWLLRVVPSVSHPLRVLLPGALFGALGFEVLKLIGGVYLSLIGNSITASAFGGAVGILVWINVVVRFAFFTAAWTASLPAVEAAGKESAGKESVRLPTQAAGPVAEPRRSTRAGGG